MDYVLMGKRDARRLGLVQAALQGRITDREGAEALGISRRQFRRLRKRVAAEGPTGLVHRGRGRPSPRRLPEEVRGKVRDLLTHAAARLNDCHLADLLRDQGIAISPDSVRRVRGTLGLPPKRRRRPVQHHRRRQRQARSGALVLVDGSPFGWLGQDGPSWTLLGALDDATGAILGLTFRPEEDLHGYAVVLRQMCTTHGLPLALYGDQTNILVRNDSHWTLEEELQGRQHPTQLGQVLEELGIGYIAAHSPQAKGRIERLWATLQDRLVAELRLHRRRTLQDALAYLPTFLERFNRRFARPAREIRSAWRRPPRDLDRILACRYQRVVTRDNTVSVLGRQVQIPPGPYRRSYQGRRVQVRELLDGRMLVLLEGRLLAEQPAPPGPFTLCPRPSPRVLRQTPPSNSSPGSRRNHDRPRPKVRARTPEARPKPQPQTRRPAPDHPWRRGLPVTLSRSRFP